MRRVPNFSLLRAFEAAARLGSFTLAAQELHLTQSAISHQVRKLEEHVQRPLFLRRNRRVQLTPEGARLQESLSRVFDAIEAACGEVRLAPHAHVLAVHCPPSLAVKWLSPRLPGFMQAHPNITIRLTSGAEPIHLLRAQEVDLAISYRHAPAAPGIVACALGTERNVPLCAPSLLRAGQPLAEQIQTLPLIDSQLNPVSWPQWFALNRLPLPGRARLSFDRAALAISSAVDGVGVALESVRLAEQELASGALVELGCGEFQAMDVETHFLSYRASEAEVEKIHVFRDWLMAQCAAPHA
ncbi:LysR substrate-binding domain-containing protein [Castellaniella sp. FW104-16D08]|uniref:LysR substrate-binding domain-containing protein n=1 Tax=unclassified Castellaniella TaxID=2617606 RepID=UPI003314A4A4